MSDTMTKFSFRQILRIQLVLILTAVVERLPRSSQSTWAIRPKSFKSADLNVGLSKNEVIVQPGDPFEVSMRIKTPMK